MFNKLLTKLFQNRNEKILNRLNKTVYLINKLEKKIKNFSDYQLKLQTKKFRKQLKLGKKINELLPEAFATVREASKRVFNMRHFDVQILGGIVLNERCIAEMRTGEGKTLTATLPAYLNALTKKGVHIVTVNDYLAKRDGENNKPLFEFLDMTVGINISGISNKMKKTAYLADVTYGTNNEYGFDYLKDNMVFSPQERVQRTLHYALIDEVDSILIDEARTPLIISGPAENSSKLYQKIDKIIPYLKKQEQDDSDFFQGKGHFSIDEKSKHVTLTERGLDLIEKLLVHEKLMKKGESLYSISNIVLMHHVMAALRAHVLFNKNVDYLVKNGEIVIVDEYTGRTMEGRRWSDGLHQAIEAKEKVEIKNENQTLASITFQNYFRLYEKLSGMTGTAYTEACEFRSIYQLDTIVIPTNSPMIRKDFPDLVFITEKEKINAIINEIKKCSQKGQPVLVGTISIEKSELISKKLKEKKIKHNVLNAKFHEMEADIIAQAGMEGAVTIATNMAGRGTDILLGGNWQAEIKKIKNRNQKEINEIKKKWKENHKKIINIGGLHIIGTEHHESRRIDNQLRGRSGRQGDPGSSRFYLSMEDSLMRIFASEKVANMMKTLGMKPGESIQHKWVTKAIAHAQRKVESRNFDIRKQLLEYDDVANDQRRAIYAQRNNLLNGSDIYDTIKKIREDVINLILNKYISNNLLTNEIQLKKLQNQLKKDFRLEISIQKYLEINKNKEKLQDQLKKEILKKMIDLYNHLEKKIGQKIMRSFEKNIMLQKLDFLWKEHCAAMDYLRQGIHLQGYAQKDPKQEYKRESFNMFSNMLNTLKYEVISTLNNIEVNQIENLKFINENSNILLKHKIYSSDKQNKKNNILLIQDQHLNKNKLGRNMPCPCKSGKKYKFCHGNLKKT
ncbi:MAG: preprotein translocase subunit SecA [Arsenophonus sp.]|nr:MAG: preprotein translocase subunit SecA [Arsenophonus sp.]